MPRVFFYVQHLLGIGHLARASHIADALAAYGFEVTVAVGGIPVAGFPGPAVERLELPAIKAGPAGFSDLVNNAGQPIDAAFRERRRALLLDEFAKRRPDILLIEAYPFGRRQMRFELTPLIEAARAARPRPLIVCSIRDILQHMREPRRIDEIVDTVKRDFDLVLVHGDPNFIRLEASFPAAARLEDRIAYTGLVAPPAPLPSEDQFDVIVSAGGGAAGRQVLTAAVDAALATTGSRWCFIAGPNLPSGDVADLQACLPPTQPLFRFRPDFANLLAAARLSISQAGYNTVCDLLRTGCRAILVPFAEGGETEQSVRAQALASRGRAHVLEESRLTGQSLAPLVTQVLANEPPAPLRLDLNGAKHTAEILRARG